MATSFSYRGGWFSNQLPTGTSFGLNTSANVLAVTMLASAGTGAFVDYLDCWQQHRLNDAIAKPSNLLKVQVIETAPARTAAENLERIREVLSPVVSDLANTFGVSRQAVYNWLNGEQPKSEHIAKLRDFAQAADIVAEAGIPITGALLKRKVIEGKNLFEVAHDGGSARNAAQLLVQMVRREATQRERMTARLAGRKTSSRSVESDFPAENDAR